MTDDSEKEPEKKLRKARKPKAFARLNVDPATITLADAAAWVEANKKAGGVCPCCDQLARIYKRKLNSSMCAALILIRRAFRTQSDWLHVPEYLSEVAAHGVIVRGGDWAKMVHWRMIEAKHGELRKDGSPRNGFYKITQLGVDFVDRRVEVPEYVILYAERLLGVSEKMATIDKALGKRFNYAELMAA